MFQRGNFTLVDAVYGPPKTVCLPMEYKYTSLEELTSHVGDQLADMLSSRLMVSSLPTSV